jgi:hypothetical protein
MVGTRTAKEYWTDWLSTSLLSKIYNWWEMTQAWYLKMASGEQIGPLTEAGLKQRLEQLTDLKEVTVRQGKSQWVAADYVISKFEQLAKNGVYLYHEDKNLGPYTLDRANELIAQNPTIDFYRFGDQDDWIHIPESRRIVSRVASESQEVPKSGFKDRQVPPLVSGSFAIQSDSQTRKSFFTFDPLIVCACFLVLSLILGFTTDVPGVALILGLVHGVSLAVLAFQRFSETPIERNYRNGVPNLPFQSPWSKEDRMTPSKAVFLRIFLMYISYGLLALIAIFFPEVYNVEGLAFFLSIAILVLFVIGLIGRQRFLGKWISATNKDRWIEFKTNGIFNKNDGTIGKYVILPNGQFIDFWHGDKLIDCVRLTSYKGFSIDIQEKDGSIVKYTNKIIDLSFLQESNAEKHRSRLRRLQEKWELVAGDGPAIQFTNDDHGSDNGAFIRFDGFAGRYTLSKEAPFDQLSIGLGDELISLRILSLERDELVLTVDGVSMHYKRGTSITVAEAKKREEAYKESLKSVGKVALATVGVVGAGIAILGVAAVAAGAAGSGGGGAGSGGESVQRPSQNRLLLRVVRVGS